MMKLGANWEKSWRKALEMLKIRCARSRLSPQHVEGASGNPVIGLLGRSSRRVGDPALQAPEAVRYNKSSYHDNRTYIGRR